MPTNLDSIKKTLVGISKGENVLDLLLEFERTLDNAEVFAYRNWILGEIVDGPNISRYWFTVTLMYPYTKMPDPNAGLRLTKIGAKVSFRKGEFERPVKVNGPDDWVEVSSKKAKLAKSKIWLVTVQLPLKYINRGVEHLDNVINADVDKSNQELAAAYEESVDAAAPVDMSAGLGADMGEEI